MKVEQGHVDISITTHHSAMSKSKSCIHVLIACRLYLLVKATIMLHLGWRIATYLPLSLKLPFLNGSPLMDGGLSHTDPDLALHFHYGSTSHPCQMHGVPGQLSSLSSFLSISVTYFFYPLPPSPPPSFSLTLSLELTSTYLGPLGDTNAFFSHINVMYYRSQEGAVFFFPSLNLSCL